MLQSPSPTQSNLELAAFCNLEFYRPEPGYPTVRGRTRVSRAGDASKSWQAPACSELTGLPHPEKRVRCLRPSRSGTCLPELRDRVLEPTHTRSPEPTAERPRPHRGVGDTALTGAGLGTRTLGRPSLLPRPHSRLT